MPQKPTCYISYSWDSGILDFLLKLKQEIERKSQNRITVILDRNNFHIGDDFKKKEKQILDSDLIITFFTPDYKKKVDTPIIDSGCYREFEYILKMWKENEHRVYPILFKGTKDYSVPKDIYNAVYNMEVSSIKYKESKSGYVTIDQHSKGKFSRFVDDIIHKTITNSTSNGIRYIDLNEKYQSLLKNTAADGTLKKSCMIKMSAYNSILNQTAYFVIGRKGSGKTTLIETLEKLEPDEFMKRYKTLCPIKAEDINIDAIYNCVQSFEKDRDYIQIKDVTDLYWETFFIMQTMYIIGIEVENGNVEPGDFRYKTFNNTKNFLRRKLGLSSNVRLNDFIAKKQLPLLVIEILNLYFKNHILDKADDITFMTSIKTNMNVYSVIESFVSKRIFNAFLAAFGSCEKKTLISLDGFDTHSEDFRRNTRSCQIVNTEEYLKRTEFESVFYRSLVSVVMRFKSGAYNSSMINSAINMMDFCIVLPQDRLDQVKEIDRDASKIKCCALAWDAFDLLQMLVLRLETYYEIEPFSNQTMLERFHRVLKEKLPKLPNAIQIRVDNRQCEFDLFNYILRLSFWRPRDILLNFISLLELVENSNNVGLEIDDRMIKDALAQSARKIIDEEFIQEYRNVFYNLKDVLNCFRNRNSIFSLSDFFSIIEKTRFDASFSYDCDNAKTKVLILYQLGVIGLCFSKDSIENRGYSHHICFYFNEGLSPIYDSIIDRDTLIDDVEIIINPLFCKMFNITITSSELIGNYDWAYIQKLSVEKSSKRRF